MLTTHDLIQDLASGCKKPQDFKIGVEHELFLRDEKGQRLSYEHIHTILLAFQENSWQPILEGNTLIGLRSPTSDYISLEPGGQFELSTAPYLTLQDCLKACYRYWNQLDHILKAHHYYIQEGACDVTTEPEDMPWMPKARYDIMRAYMPQKGTHGIHMMTRTCTVQANLDFSSEADMVQKFRISLALQPFVTALFANSPHHENNVDYASFRARIWHDTDPDRCGFPSFVFDEGFGFERYVNYVRHVPMYFVRRNGRYHNVAGASFIDFQQGKLKGFEGVYATIDDWHDQLSIVFPEVRLKHYLEMRGADVGSREKICALPAFWMGFLYDPTNLEEIGAQIATWSFKEMRDLYQAVPRLGKKAIFQNQSLKDWNAHWVQRAKDGLNRLNLTEIVGAG
jgi:glutamate--cysteine ligase